MATTINADTAIGGAVVTGDASGVLALQAAGNTALTLNSSRAVGVGATPDYGTSGQVLTSAGSSAAPTWATVAPSGITTANTQSITSNLSLTSASAGLQVISSDQDGRAVILPDATTLTVGAPKFVINNAGNFQLGVRDYAGTLLASIDAGGTAIMSLSSIATSAGAWDVDGTGLLAGLCVGEVQLGTLAQGISVAQASTPYSFTKLSETLVVYYYYNTTTSTSYMRTFDYSTSTFGTEYNMNNSPFSMYDNNFLGFYRTSDTSFFVVNYTSAGNYQMVACTVSGGVITAGSATTLGAEYGGDTNQSRNCIVQLSDSLVVISNPFGSAPTLYARAFSISGTTITAGTAASTTNSGSSNYQNYKLSGTSILYSTYESGIAQYYLVASVSGTTITFGTQISSTTYQVRSSTVTTAAWIAPICVIDDNKFIVGYTNPSNSNRPSVVCVTVSGTTMTFGTGVEIAQQNFNVASSTSFTDNGATVGYQGYQPIQKISTTAFFLNFNTTGNQSVISSGTVSGSTITITPYSLQSFFCANTNSTSADGFGGWIPSNGHKLPFVEIGTYPQIYLRQQSSVANVYNASLMSVYISNNQPTIGKNISYVNNPSIANTYIPVNGVASLTLQTDSSFRFGPYIVIKYTTQGQKTGSALVYKCVGNSIVFLGEMKTSYSTNFFTLPLTNTKMAAYEAGGNFYPAGASTNKPSYFYRFYEVVA